MIVYWSYKARARLREIHEFIAVDSPMRATRMVGRLIRRGDALATGPRADRRVPEFAETDLREVLERPYRIIYRIGAGRIDILTVKHYRQRLPAKPTRL